MQAFAFAPRPRGLHRAAAVQCRSLGFRVGARRQPDRARRIGGGAPHGLRHVGSMGDQRMGLRPPREDTLGHGVVTLGNRAHPWAGVLPEAGLRCAPREDQT